MSEGGRETDARVIGLCRGPLVGQSTSGHCETPRGGAAWEDILEEVALHPPDTQFETLEKPLPSVTWARRQG